MKQNTIFNSVSVSVRTRFCFQRELVTTAVLVAFQLSATAPAKAATLHFTADAKIKRGDKAEFTPVSSGSAVEVSPGESVFVLTQRGIPMLVIGASAKDSKIEISDPELSNVVKERLGPALEEATREIVNELRRAELLVQRQDLQGARAVIAPLKSKYPTQSTVLFLSASVLYLLGDHMGASGDLKKGLELDPKNESALKLLERLKGAQ
jgi:hypothetical protein